jgi:hypothetical protein
MEPARFRLIEECPKLVTKPWHVIQCSALGLMSGSEEAGLFGWRPIDTFVFIALNFSVASVFKETIMTRKDIDLGLSIGPVDHLDGLCMAPHRYGSVFSAAARPRYSRGASARSYPHLTDTLNGRLLTIVRHALRIVNPLSRLPA